MGDFRQAHSGPDVIIIGHCIIGYARGAPSIRLHCAALEKIPPGLGIICARLQGVPFIRLRYIANAPRVFPMCRGRRAEGGRLLIVGSDTGVAPYVSS